MIPKSLYYLLKLIAHASAFILLLPLALVGNTIDISRTNYPLYLTLLLSLNAIEIYLAVKIVEYMAKYLKIKLDTSK